MKEIILNENEIKYLLPRRKRTAHKGSVGKILVVAGSRGMTGAGILASRAALKTGAGLVTLATPNYLADLVDIASAEVMTLPLHETSSGSISRKAVNLVGAKLEESDILLLGPGLSRIKETVLFARDILMLVSNELKHVKTILDADGLRALNHIVRPFKSEIIITPHIAEFARIVGLKISDIRKKPMYYLKKLRDKLGINIVLKSHETISLSYKRDEYFVTAHGNPGMATAGAGDVLSGIMASLWGQGLSADEVSVVGPYLHADAGNLAARKKSIDGIIAGDILNSIPYAIKRLKGR